MLGTGEFGALGPAGRGVYPRAREAGGQKCGGRPRIAPPRRDRSTGPGRPRVALRNRVRGIGPGVDGAGRPTKVLAPKVAGAPRGTATAPGIRSEFARAGLRNRTNARLHLDSLPVPLGGDAPARRDPAGEPNHGFDSTPTGRATPQRNVGAATSLVRTVRRARVHVRRHLPRTGCLRVVVGREARDRALADVGRYRARRRRRFLLHGQAGPGRLWQVSRRSHRQALLLSPRG